VIRAGIRARRSRGGTAEQQLRRHEGARAGGGDQGSALHSLLLAGQVRCV